MGTLASKLQELMAMRSQLQGEIEALQNKLAGLDMAIAYFDPGSIEQEEDDAPKTSVKNTLIALLEEAGMKGLNSSLAIQKAARRGIKLERGSVSSMLSRFKRDGIACYDGERYRLKQYLDKGFGDAMEDMAAA